MAYETIKEFGRPGAILTVRSMLLAILLIGLTGTGAELLLLNHVESLWQWVPVLLILLSFVVLGWHGVWTGNIGNSFHGGSDWAQRFLEGGTGGPTRSRSFVIREM